MIGIDQGRVIIFGIFCEYIFLDHSKSRVAIKSEGKFFSENNFSFLGKLKEKYGNPLSSPAFFPFCPRVACLQIYQM